MNKLDMAHDFVMNCIKNPAVTLKADDIQNIINNSWIYTDIMQAEADKREPKGFPDVLQDDWQPDWSQAPSNMNYFFMNKNGSKYWAVNKPDKPNFTEHVMNFRNCGGDCYKSAQSQDYQGDWKQSLRRRPQ